MGRFTLDLTHPTNAAWAERLGPEAGAQRAIARRWQSIVLYGTWWSLAIAAVLRFGFHLTGPAVAVMVVWFLAASAFQTIQNHYGKQAQILAARYLGVSGTHKHIDWRSLHDFDTWYAKFEKRQAAKPSVKPVQAGLAQVNAPVADPPATPPAFGQPVRGRWLTPHGVEVLPILTLRDLRMPLLRTLALYPFGLIFLIAGSVKLSPVLLATALVMFSPPFLTVGWIYGTHRNSVWLTADTLIVPSGLGGRGTRWFGLSDLVAVRIEYVTNSPAGWRLVFWRSNARVWRLGPRYRAPAARESMSKSAKTAVAHQIANSSLGKTAQRVRERALELQGETSALATEQPFPDKHLAFPLGAWSAGAIDELTFGTSGEVRNN